MTFTVIGFYPDTGQRFADIVEARDADTAEDRIKAENEGLVVG